MVQLDTVNGDAYRSAVDALLRECRGLAQRGLVLAAAGNASVAVGDHILLTASGAAFADLDPSSLTLVDRSGAVVAGERAPTSELALHLRVHRRGDVGAVVHTHGRHAVALSTVSSALPVLHYYCVDLGDSVPVAPYRCFGTEELSAVTAAALGTGNGVLMANHGSLTVGSSVKQAAERAELLEWLCQVALLATAAGRPTELSRDQLQEVRAAMHARRADPLPDPVGQP